MRSTLLALAFFFGTSLVAQNAYLTNCFVPRFWKAGANWSVEARVRNSSGTTQLITFRVGWRWNNGPVQTGNWQSTTGIGPGQYWPYVHQIPFNQPESAGTLKVWVEGNGDTDQTNDTLSFPLGVIPAWTAKSVLIEQYTGTWCQYSYNTNITTNALDEDPLIVLAKHHKEDEFSTASSTAYWAQFGADYSPAGVVEQEEFGTLPDDGAYDQWGVRADLRKTGVSPTLITIVPGFNDWTRLLTVDVGVTTTSAISGDFTLNAYILEDNVPGPQNLAPPDYLHHQVVREVLGGVNGISGVIPPTTTPGGAYAHQFTFTVPAEWNSDNLRVIAMVTEHRLSGTHTINVADADVLEVGVEEQAASPIMSVSPNPSNNILRLALREAVPAQVQVLGMDGRVVLVQRTEGSSVVLDGFSELAAGTYLVRVQQGNSLGEQRIVRY